MFENVRKRFPYLLPLIIVLIFIKGLTLWATMHAGFGLMPDEAQYWTWSKMPAYGYYSKPPGIAWEIGFGTLIFGDTEFGVRFGALLLSFLLAIAIYLLARSGGLEGRYAFWSSIAFSVTPVGVLSTCLATTDCGFGLFWTLAASLFVRRLLEDKPHAFIKIGVLIGLGALFKWTIYLLWLPILIFALWQRKLRLRFIIGFLISLIGLTPSLVWNMQHDFATFKHVLRAVTPPEGGFSFQYALNFLGAQFALLSPLLFLLVIFATVGLAKMLKRLPLSIAFYWWTSVMTFVAVLILSCIKKVQGNWAVMSYFTLFPMLFAYAAMQKEAFLRWIQGALLLSIALLTFIFFHAHEVPYKMNPWKEGLGWKRLEKGLLQTGYDPAKHFLFGDRYQTASILSFYGPEKKRAYFFNLQGLRKNQFSYWKQMADRELGRTGFYVTIIDGPNALDRAIDVQKRMCEQLAPYFDEVDAPLVIIPLYETNHKVTKVAVVVRADGYNGTMPPDPGKF